MNIANMHAEGSGVTMRLKALLENISRLVDYLPGTEQKALLELLEDWKHPERRKNPRKFSSLPVDFVVDGCAFTGSIRDIGAEGVYIEAIERFSVGQEIVFYLSVPGLPRSVKTSGEIVWTDDNGFGAKLTMSSKYLEEYLKHGLESL